MSKFLDRFRFNGDMESVHAASIEILTTIGAPTSETTEIRISAATLLRNIKDPKAIKTAANDQEKAKDEDEEPGSITIELDFTMLSETKTQARITINIVGGPTPDMTPRCNAIAQTIIDHIHEKYPLELAQARQTELPPETKQRISLPFLIATIALLVIAGVGIYTVYTFLTPDRKFEKATVENKKKQRMDNSESNQSPSGPPKPNNSETAGKQKAPKPAIRLALAFGPVSPLGCIFELELSKPASLPLLRLHADMEFIGMGETVITSKTLKLDLNSDPMRSKYSGQLALLEIPCNVVSQAIIADVTACQVRDKPTSFCRKLVKDDPRSKFPIRRF